MLISQSLSILSLYITIELLKYRDETDHVS